MIIAHYTCAEHAQDILDSGYIDLEGCNAKRGMDKMPRHQRRMIYKLIGRHAWFSSAATCKTASYNQHAFYFDSDDIGAVKWSKYKQRFRNSPAKWRMVEALDDSARDMGDDSDDYWICDTRVSLAKQLETA